MSGLTGFSPLSRHCLPYPPSILGGLDGMEYFSEQQGPEIVIIKVQNGGVLYSLSQVFTFLRFLKMKLMII